MITGADKRDGDRNNLQDRSEVVRSEDNRILAESGQLNTPTKPHCQLPTLLYMNNNAPSHRFAPGTARIRVVVHTKHPFPSWRSLYPLMCG